MYHASATISSDNLQDISAERAGSDVFWIIDVSLNFKWFVFGQVVIVIFYEGLLLCAAHTYNNRLNCHRC